MRRVWETRAVVAPFLNDGGFLDFEDFIAATNCFFN